MYIEHEVNTISLYHEVLVDEKIIAFSMCFILAVSSDE